MDKESNTAKQDKGSVQDEPQGLEKELDATPIEDSEASAESTEAKVESVEGAEGTEPQETIEDRITSLAQRIADKSTKTLNANNARLQERITELEEQLSDRAWDSEMKALFGEESESLGEDDAKKRMVNRQRISDETKQYRKNSRFIESTMKKIGVDNVERLDSMLQELNVPNLDQAMDVVDTGIRTHMAEKFILELLVPEAKEMLKPYQSLLEKFNKARDREDFEIIAEGIREKYRSTSSQTTHIPDSGTKVGVGLNLNDMSARDLIKVGISQQKKK